MKAYGEVDVEIHIFLTLALAGGEWSASCPGHFTLGEQPPWYPLERRLGGPQSWSGQCGENSWPYRDSNSDPSVIHPVASRYTDCAIPTPALRVWSKHNVLTLEQKMEILKDWEGVSRLCDNWVLVIVFFMILADSSKPHMCWVTYCGCYPCQGGMDLHSRNCHCLHDRGLMKLMMERSQFPRGWKFIPSRHSRLSENTPLHLSEVKPSNLTWKHSPTDKPNLRFVLSVSDYRVSHLRKQLSS
jgi:hypothetical protein